MVLYSDNPAVMYQQLHTLERAAEGRGRKRKLQIHNFVNNADAVPRFLGGSLDAVHSAVEFYVPSMSVSAFCTWTTLILCIWRQLSLHLQLCKATQA